MFLSHDFDRVQEMKYKLLKIVLTSELQVSDSLCLKPTIALRSRTVKESMLL